MITVHSRTLAFVRRRHASRLRVLFLSPLLLILFGLDCRTTPTGPQPGVDTTSHAFTWEVTMLGDGQSSVLWDVVIINDSLAYAAGEIYVRDSLGQWETKAYNLARWNGHAWSLHRIWFYTICGQSGFSAYPGRAVLAFGANDVWIATWGSQVARWNGSQQTAIMCGLPVVIRKMWGSSPSSIYAVGEAGKMAHFDGSTWTDIACGTTLPFQDIWGGARSNGSMEIIALASNMYELPQGRKMFAIQNGTALELPDSGLSLFARGLWFVPDQKYYAVGSGVFWKSAVASFEPWKGYPVGVATSKASLGIRASGPNDILVVGFYGEIAHYNGSTWRTYREQIPDEPGPFNAVAMRGNIAIAVGSKDVRGRIAVGRR